VTRRGVVVERCRPLRARVAVMRLMTAQGMEPDGLSVEITSQRTHCPRRVDRGGVGVHHSEMTDDSDGGGPLGEMPPEFTVVAPGSAIRPAIYTEQLDEVEHFVVVTMAEPLVRRSAGIPWAPSQFEVRGRSRPAHEPDTGANSAPSWYAGRAHRREPRHEDSLQSDHGLSHAGARLACQNAKATCTGRISGFAADFGNRYPGFAEHVMTYYTGDDLTAYDRLAREHAVCDHWFAAFPRGTWPNRWTTLSGTTPHLHNLGVDDSRKRPFGDSHVDRYRLDTEHIVQFIKNYAESKGFDAIAQNGRLPEATCVEPNFRDIPPFSTANDYLAPPMREGDMKPLRPPSHRA
jgi:hypothetical protein